MGMGAELGLFCKTGVSPWVIRDGAGDEGGKEGGEGGGYMIIPIGM